MSFDWLKAVEKNRDDLLMIVTRLFIMAGIRSFARVTVLPRGLRTRILSILRPAEFAARRLIAMAACHLVVTRRPAEGRGTTPPSSVILGFNPRTHSVKPEPSADDGEKKDNLHHRGFGEVSGVGPRVILGLDPKTSEAPSSLARTRDDGVVETPQPTAKSGPDTALPAFKLFDPLKPYSLPWLEEGDDDENDESDWPQFHLPPGEPVDARPVCRRILALEAALQDLEGQARRLARWRARRHLETARPRRWQPMRPGRPSGWCKRPKTAVEEVLKECHSLARYAWTAPDTS